jgi:simple sugar transport system permease protein
MNAKEKEKRNIFKGSSLYLGLAVLFIAGCIIEPSFLTLENQRDVLQRISINGIIAVGMTLVILTAGIDLSVGSLLSLCSVLCAMMVMGRQWNKANVIAVIAVSIIAGLVSAWTAARILDKRIKSKLVIAIICSVIAIAFAAAAATFGSGQARHGFGLAAVLLFVPLAGAALGAANGFIIGNFKMQPFIVTLAMMICAVGMAKYIAGKGGQIHAVYVLSNEEQSDSSGLAMLQQQLQAEGKGYASESFSSLGQNFMEVRTWNERLQKYDGTKIIPVTGIFFLLCVGLTFFILTRLPFGRYIYAIGGNEETSRFSGINVKSIKIMVYAISGLLSGLAAVLYCAMYGQGKPDAGQGVELDAIAAVVIGGTSLMGGKGKIMGTFIGVLIFGYLSNILVLKGIPSEVQDILKGIIIILAVLLQAGHVGRLLLPAFHHFQIRKEITV